MSVTYPRGFVAGGIAAGIKPSGRADLALLVGETGTAVAGVFTTNAIAAAPVSLSRERLSATGGRSRAVLVNSGQANAARGARGAADARVATSAAADALGLSPEEVLACSTGVIGEPLHMEELLAAVPDLAMQLSPEGGGDFARAILTTDRVEKRATAEVGRHRVGGCAKGVGMISPNLATMLVFVTTDAGVAPDDLSRLVHEQLGPRFNSVTIDGCSSTNDTILLLASGAAGGREVSPGTSEWEALSTAVARVGESLLRQMLSDAEGATRILTIDVEGAASERDARLVAREIADSPLVKTAAFGGDPNPGRIVQAVGSSGADLDAARLAVWLGETQVVVDGTVAPDYFGGDLREQAQREMKEQEVRVAVSLGTGPGRSRVLGCDLSYEYVRINGEYTT